MNKSVPTGTEIVRPFVPARDFDLHSPEIFPEGLGGKLYDAAYGR